MGSFSLWHWVIVLLVVVIIFAVPRFRNQSKKPFEPRSHPVFSSVAARGNEVEHIDEKLPRRPSLLVMSLALLLLVALVWLSFRG